MATDDRDDIDVLMVAERAVQAWQSPDDATRGRALANLATSAYQDAAAMIDATRVPSAPPERVRLRAEADGQALVDVRLGDGTDLAVLLVLHHDRWLVDDVQPITDLGTAGRP